MEYQYPYNGDEPTPSSSPPPPAASPESTVDPAGNGTNGAAGGTGDLPPLGALGTTLMVVGNILYLLTAVPAYAIFVLATQLLEESQLDPLTFWASVGWLISFAASWGAFVWLYRDGAARRGAVVFLGIFFFWCGTSLLSLFAFA
ncbi:hypothetical protein N2K95_03210 [Arthrobacter zhaoxinii]|uniref:Uncharacterized protein n=1 Tax=Arthrobacter zhaoxinii TaxID=2964616 RepID=A0ABY5YRI5_9MICC|nr:hypothetical protein [Arthrobacter zhaoxinii]UWX97707.1 hypothetical protein N2K95_03210 [Arthrobacter zhaoxinii]